MTAPGAVVGSMLESAVDVDGPVVLTVAVAAFLIGLAKGGFSGIGPVITLLVSLAVPTTVAIGVLLPLLMIGDTFAIWAHWGHWDRSMIGRLLPGSIVGIVVASVFLQSVSDTGLRYAIAAVVLAVAMYKLLEERLGLGEVRLRPQHAALAGGTAGVTSTIAHIGGPPIAVYLLLAGTAPRTFVATSALFFAVTNWLKVPGYLAADLLDATLIAKLSPTALLIPPGVLAGRSIVTRISKVWFDRFILLSLVGGAILLVV